MLLFFCHFDPLAPDSLTSTLARERALVSGLLARLAHPALIQLVLMLLASLHNAARDDTEVLLVHAALILALSP